jgi:hypothetical protein
MKSFDDFKSLCIEEISSFQDEFKKIYDHNSYEKWSFNKDFGVFQFESDGLILRSVVFLKSSEEM